ncbi:MAG: glycosyltransferase [Candidatus Zambryskibacteria bacterium]|nr:glycosyltransferase [Candidatus Zambryskibacteria bacterium]
MNNRIVFVTSDWKIGGRDKAILIIIEHLAIQFTDYNFELWVVGVNSKNTFEKPELRYPKNVHFRKFSSKSTFSLFVLLLKNFHKYPPKLLFFFSNPFIVVPLFFAKLMQFKNIPHVIVDQTYFELPVGGMKRLIQRLILSQAYKKSVKEVANSKVLQSYVKKTYSLKPEQSKLIYNPIFSEDKQNSLFPMEYLQFKDKYILINVGRFHPQKDYKTMLEGFQKIAEEISESVLILIGDGPQKEYILELIDELKLTEKVFLLGLKDNPFPYIQHSHLFIFSSNSEGLPGALVEAMGLGVPVVATDCPTGPRELLGNNNEYGILIPMKDPKALCHAVISLYKDQSKVCNYIKKGKERVEMFTEENTKQEYQKLFSEVLATSDFKGC